MEGTSTDFQYRELVSHPTATSSPTTNIDDEPSSLGHVPLCVPISDISSQLPSHRALTATIKCHHGAFHAQSPGTLNTHTELTGGPFIDTNHKRGHISISHCLYKRYNRRPSDFAYTYHRQNSSPRHSQSRRRPLIAILFRYPTLPSIHRPVSS
jgi:hypothetical protein